MKTKMLYLFAGIIIVGMVLFITWLFNRPCEQWEKPANVPVSTVWKGGCDGGNWVELVDVKADTIRLRIYRDWNGDLILDADFVSENCNNLQLTKENWNEFISYFDGKKIYSKIQSDSSYCQFVPVFPAYYEEKIK